MTIKKTIKIKVGKLSDTKVSALLSNALNWSNQVADYYLCWLYINGFSKNKKHIHNETYSFLRQHFPNLNSKCLQQIRDKVLATARPNKTVKINTPIIADHQSFKVSFGDDINIKHFTGILRLWKTDIPLVLCKNHIRMLKEAKKLTYVELIPKKDGQWYCYLVCDFEAKPARTSGKAVGVDRGINNIAVMSTGKFFGGKRLIHKKNEFRKHKRQQSGEKLNNFQRDANHKISKAIVQEALNQNASVIRFEDLSGIRSGDKGKKFNFSRSNWAYYQLEQFTAYKAAMVGLKVEFGNPAYTSKCCSKCEQLGVRKGNDFYCKSCDWRTHADWNGSRNIRKGDGFHGRTHVNERRGTPAIANGVIESTPLADLGVRITPEVAGNPLRLS
jgi:IS605 OrfB family transposase